jgi:hypothetical protein
MANLTPYWRTRTVGEAMAQGYAVLRLTCSFGRITDIPFTLLLQRRGVSREGFSGNIRFRCTTCGETIDWHAFTGPKVSHGNAKVISFRDAIAGVLIGAMEHNAWPLVFISCLIWAMLSWLFVSTVMKKAEYRSVPRLSFVSPTVSRIIVWWTTAFAVSLLFASVTVLILSLM